MVQAMSSIEYAPPQSHVVVLAAHGENEALIDPRQDPPPHAARILLPRLSEHLLQLPVLDLQPLVRALEHDAALDRPEREEQAHDELPCAREAERRWRPALAQPRPRCKCERGRPEQRDIDADVAWMPHDGVRARRDELVVWLDCDLEGEQRAQLAEAPLAEQVRENDRACAEEEER